MFFLPKASLKVAGGLCGLRQASAASMSSVVASSTMASSVRARLKLAVVFMTHKLPAMQPKSTSQEATLCSLLPIRYDQPLPDFVQSGDEVQIVYYVVKYMDLGGGSVWIVHALRNVRHYTCDTQLSNTHVLYSNNKRQVTVPE